MGSRKRLLQFLAATALSAGIIALVAGALWMIGSASGERAKFSSLEIAPRDADVFVAMNTDPTSPQWLGVIDSLGSINAKDPVRRAIDEALAEVNLDWEKDILPIAGDEAFFSIPEVSEVDDGGGYVAAFRLRNTAKAQEVFDGLRERAVEQGEEYETEEYEGVTIHSVVKPDLDGDPSTESDCKVDDQGTILCDGQAPIPEDPYVTCFELAFEGITASEVPADCVPFFECPDYAFDPAAVNEEDLNGNGRPDSCEEVDRIKREWEESIEFAAPYQDCADLADVSDSQCEDVSTLGTRGAVALFADVIAVGASPDDVKAVIDVVQGRAPSAEENERLQEFREAQKEDFLMWGYADLGPVWDMAEAGILTDIGTNGESDPIETTQPPAATPQPDVTAVPEGDFRITSFDSEYTIDANGSLQVKETIAVDFGTVEKHGILRRIDTRIPYDFIDDELLEVVRGTVTRDGVEEPFQTPVKTGEYFQFEIGDFNHTITGPHVYEMAYTIRGGIRQWTTGDDPYYEVMLNATGDDWGVPIEQASVTFIPPSGTLSLRSCVVGRDPGYVFGSDIFDSCSGEFSETRAHFGSNGPIESGSGLRFLVGIHGESGARPPLLVPTDPGYFDDGASFPVEDDSIPFDIDREELLEEVRGTYDRVGFSVSATGDGFAVDVTVLQAPSFEPKYAAVPSEVFDSDFADSVPADTMFFFAGYDLYGQNWVPLRNHLEDVKFRDRTTLDGFLQEFADKTGLDLEADILELLTGEYAIAGDVSDFDEDAPEFSILAMLDVADADHAQQSLGKLGEYLEGEDAVKIDEDEGIQRWTIPGSSAEVVGITVSGHSVIAGYPDSAVEDAVIGFDDSLGATDDWKRTVGLLPDDTTSIGFLSVARVLEEARKMDDAERSLEEATDGELTLADLTSIRSIGYATTTMEGGYSARLVLLISD